MSHDQKDGRGSSEDRRRRKRWLVSPEAGFGGNGRSVPCRWCGKRLRLGRALEADRYPICGHAGGTYRRDNIVPACRKCNATRCQACIQEVRERNGLLSRERPDTREELTC